MTEIEEANSEDKSVGTARIMMTDIQTQASEVVYTERADLTTNKTPVNKTTQIWLFDKVEGEREIEATRK